MNQPSNPVKKPHRPYEAPGIVHKGQLKQFAGSPLSPDPQSPIDILGLSN